MQAQPVAPPAPTTSSSTPADRSVEFHAIQGNTETRSGTVLLVEAYVALWLILFGFLWLTARRQRKLESRLIELENALTQARKEKG